MDDVWVVASVWLGLAFADNSARHSANGPDELDGNRRTHVV